MGPIDFYLVRNNLRRLMLSRHKPACLKYQMLTRMLLHHLSPTQEIRGNEIIVQGVVDQRMCSEARTSQHFVSGIMKIVPDVDIDADYWPLLDTDISITNMWGMDSGFNWNSLDEIHEAYPMAGTSAPPQSTTAMPTGETRQPQTPPQSAAAMPSRTNIGGS